MEVRHHWNIPDEVDPVWTARRELADALRALNERCVRTTSAAAEIDAATALVRQALAALQDGPTVHDAWKDGSYFEQIPRYVDRGALMGRCNPVAPPMDIHWVDGESRCHVVLPDTYVGAPGMVHGGIIAALFDQLCGHTMVMSGRSGFTVKLLVRYPKPTPVNRELLFTARLVKAGERALTVHGQCHVGDTQVARCEAHFIQLDLDRARAVIEGS